MGRAIATEEGSDYTQRTPFHDRYTLRCKGKKELCKKKRKKKDNCKKDMGGRSRMKDMFDFQIHSEMQVQISELNPEP